MGNLAHSADMRAFWLKAEIPYMIEKVIIVALKTLRASIEALTTRLEMYEWGQGITTRVTTLKVDVSELRKDVDHLKSTYFILLFGIVKIQDDPSANVPSCSEVPAHCDVPLDTIRDDSIEDAAIVESETNEEQFEVWDAGVYEDLADLEGAMFETARQASLRVTIMAGSSASTTDEISGTDAQPQSLTPGTDASIDGATEMQTSPRP